MTANHELPRSGYLLEQLYANELHLRVKHPDAEPSRDDQIIFGWDWEVINADIFEVRLILGVDPTPARLEEIRLTLSGRFRVASDAPSVGFEDFVRLHAVAILFPYARELLTSISGRGFYQPVLLPALNIVQLMKDKDLAQTTGARQLAEGRSVRGMLSNLPPTPRAEAEGKPSTTQQTKSRTRKKTT